MCTSAGSKLNKGELRPTSPLEPTWDLTETGNNAWIICSAGFNWNNVSQSKCDHTLSVLWTAKMDCLLYKQISYGSHVSHIQKKMGQFSILTACSLSCPHCALLLCSLLCILYNQNTPLTMSRPKWEEMRSVSAHLQHDDVVISGA